LAEGEDAGLDKAFGVLWRNAQNRMSWQAVIQETRRQVQELFEQINPDGLISRDGRVYHKQTVVTWSLPEESKSQSPNQGSRFGVEAVDNRGEGVRVTRVWAGYPGTKVTDVATKQVLQLQRGDVILSINGRTIHGTKDYWDAVKSSPELMKFTVRDVRDGQKRDLQTQLRN
jgi:S1-C subfamily serine protease